MNQLDEQAAAPQGPQQPGSHPSRTGAANGPPAGAQGPQWRQLPQALRDRPQWLLAGPNDKGERKVPKSVDGAGNICAGSSTDRTTWMTFERATQAATANGYRIGYVLAADDPFTCIDLDVKPDTPQEQLDRYASMVQAFDTYTERSQSGRGLHIWCTGKVGKGLKRDGVELYSQERFIACTGDVLRDAPIADRQGMLDNMAAQMREAHGPAVATLDDASPLQTDDAVLNRAKRAANADKFGALWAGQWTAMGYRSQSEADMALMGMLGYYSKSNEQCRRLFRHSALGQRDKAQKDDRYLDLTLKTVRGRQAQEDAECGGTVEHGAQVAAAILAHAMNRMRAAPEQAGTWTRVSVADVCTNPAAPVEFLIEDLLPAREVTLLPADGGAGKSLLTLIAAVCQAMGLPFMGKGVTRCKVVFYSGEDDGRVLRGRLRRVCEHYDVNPAELAGWLLVIGKRVT